MKFLDTILAQSTPIGNSGVGIIRISGNKSYKIAKIILNIKKIKIRYAHFCKFINKNKKIMDYGIAIYYKSPNSFTGENILELQCHGGQKNIEKIIKQILNLNIKNVRISKPGEFIKRSFLNNKIDLIQAESINNIIKSNSDNQINSSIISIEGNFSKIIKKNIKIINNINIKIIKIINFSEKPLLYKNIKLIYKKIKYININIKNLYKKIKKNKFIKEGIKLTIIGKPNTGKSSLMNLLTNKKNSIITNIPGTTRDIIKDYINIENINIEITDTTGIRKTSNIIEKIGIKKTFNEIKKSKIIIFLFNAKKISENNIFKYYKKIIKKNKKNKIFILIRNKIDLTNEKTKKWKKNNLNIINISIKKKIGINLLYKIIIKNIKKINNTENKFYTNERHILLIKKVKKNINKAINKLKIINNKNIKKTNLDIISKILYSIQKYLNQIIGTKKFTSKKIINNIFKNFCIGK